MSTTITIQLASGKPLKASIDKFKQNYASWCVKQTDADNLNEFASDPANCERFMTLLRNENICLQKPGKVARCLITVEQEPYVFEPESEEDAAARKKREFLADLKRSHAPQINLAKSAIADFEAAMLNQQNEMTTRLMQQIEPAAFADVQIEMDKLRAEMHLQMAKLVQTVSSEDLIASEALKCYLPKSL